MRFWASWWSGNYADEGCTKPDPGTFLHDRFWITGQRERINYGLTDEQHQEYLKIKTEAEAEEFLNRNYKDDCSICAVIDAESEKASVETIKKFFPDCVMRFCDQTDPDYDPTAPGGSGRFRR